MSYADQSAEPELTQAELKTLRFENAKLKRQLKQAVSLLEDVFAELGSPTIIKEFLSEVKEQ